MATRGEKETPLTKRIKDILWFTLGALIGLFSLIGVYVVALYVL